MKKIVYPILLLVLTACKGNQQTTNNEFAAIPVAETIADTIATTRSGCHHFSYLKA